MKKTLLTAAVLIGLGPQMVAAQTTSNYCQQYPWADCRGAVTPDFSSKGAVIRSDPPPGIGSPDGFGSANRDGVLTTRGGLQGRGSAMLEVTNDLFEDSGIFFEFDGGPANAGKVLSYVITGPNITPGDIFNNAKSGTMSLDGAGRGGVLIFGNQDDMKEAKTPAAEYPYSEEARFILTTPSGENLSVPFLVVESVCYEGLECGFRSKPARDDPNPTRNAGKTASISITGANPGSWTASDGPSSASSTVAADGTAVYRFTANRDRVDEGDEEILITFFIDGVQQGNRPLRTIMIDR